MLKCFPILCGKQNLLQEMLRGADAPLSPPPFSRPCLCGIKPVLLKLCKVLEYHDQNYATAAKLLKS